MATIEDSSKPVSSKVPLTQSEIQTLRWQDPIYRERMQKQISTAYTRRMKQRLIDLATSSKG